jgi:hypothetical protein
VISISRCAFDPGSTVKTKRADLTDLDRADGAVAFRAIRDGLCVFSRSDTHRVRAIVDVARRYDDETPMRELFREAARKADATPYRPRSLPGSRRSRQASARPRAALGRRGRPAERVVHDYVSVDLSRLARTVREDLGDLREFAELVLTWG